MAYYGGRQYGAYMLQPTKDELRAEIQELSQQVHALRKDLSREQIRCDALKRENARHEQFQQKLTQLLIDEGIIELAPTEEQADAPASPEDDDGN